MSPDEKAEADREFARQRMEWLEAVQDDPQISAAGFSLTFAISRHLNRQTGDAWPGQKLLGGLARVKERQVRNLLRLLVERGHLTIESGGFQRPDRYRPPFTDRQPIAAPDRQPNAALEAPDRQSSDTDTGNGLPPNPLKEPLEKSAALSIDEKRLAEELFAIMPKGSKSRSNRDRVCQAFAEVVAKGTPAKALDLAVRAFVREAPDAKDQDGRFMGPADKWLTTKRGWEAYLPSADELFLAVLPQTDRDWLYRVRSWQRTPGYWRIKGDDFGPEPGQPGCRVPSHVIRHALACEPANDTTASAPPKERVTWV